MKKHIYKFIFFKLMGWKLTGNINSGIKKCIFIVVPHTSWHDFYLGILTRGVIDLEMNFVAKKELFKFPFEAYFRWMGGEPLDRTGGLNKVDAIADIFSRKEIFRLAIAPEGTREKVAEWKTGFYYIAQKANIPIIPVAFDFGKKEVILHEPFYPTGNIVEDFKMLEQNFIGVLGKNPENGFTPKN